MNLHLAATPAADIREQAGRHWWRCPNCGQTLGEIVGNRLVIVIRGERVLSFRLRGEIDQTCHRCHHVSVYLLACDTIIPH